MEEGTSNLSCVINVSQLVDAFMFIVVCFFKCLEFSDKGKSIKQICKN